MPVARALEIAGRAARATSAVAGRIDAEEEFEDEHHRPLVFRRTRLETARREVGGRPIEDLRRAVPFEIVDGLDRIAIDIDALDVGLVVVIRESEGTAADDPGARACRDLARDTPVRLRIEQLSSVDHAVACGMPALDDAGGAVSCAPGMRPAADRDHARVGRRRCGCWPRAAGGRRALSRSCWRRAWWCMALGAAWWVVDAVV